MSTWVAVVAGGVVSLVSVLAGVLVQWKLGQKQVDRDRREARIQRVAGVLGRMRPLVVDLQPRLLLMSQPSVVQGIYKDTWRPLRAELSALAAAEPSDDVRDELLGLEDSIELLFVSLMFLVSRELREWATATGELLGNTYGNAANQQADAERRLRKILGDLHAPGEDSTGDSTPRSAEAITTTAVEPSEESETPA